MGTDSSIEPGRVSSTYIKKEEAYIYNNVLTKIFDKQFNLLRPRRRITLLCFGYRETLTMFVHDTQTQVCAITCSLGKPCLSFVRQILQAEWSDEVIWNHRPQGIQDARHGAGQRDGEIYCSVASHCLVNNHIQGVS